MVADIDHTEVGAAAGGPAVEAVESDETRGAAVGVEARGDATHDGTRETAAGDETSKTVADGITEGAAADEELASQTRGCGKQTSKDGCSGR